MTVTNGAGRALVSGLGLLLTAAALLAGTVAWNMESMQQAVAAHYAHDHAPLALHLERMEHKLDAINSALHELDKRLVALQAGRP